MISVTTVVAAASLWGFSEWCGKEMKEKEILKWYHLNVLHNTVVIWSVEWYPSDEKK